MRKEAENRVENSVIYIMDYILSNFETNICCLDSRRHLVCEKLSSKYRLEKNLRAPLILCVMGASMQAETVQTSAF
jgi:hypothetical protein